MSFITPTFLFAAGAALLPVLYHLIRKMRARRVRFSSLLFLRATPKALIKRRRLRDILLLIVRACILGLLAFVFARPFFPRESLPVALQASDTSTVILLDTSYSMQYGDRFERARDAALDIIDDAGAADEIALVVFSDHAEQLSELTNDITLLRNVVNNAVTAGNRTTDLYQPFRLADEILGSARHQRREIVLISDFQETGWNSRLDNWSTDANTVFTPMAIEDNRTVNSYIDQLVIEKRHIGDAETVQLRLQIQSRGTHALEEHDVSLWLNGREIERKTVEATGARQLFFQRGDLREGVYQGHVLLGDDNLEIDNHRYFTFPVSARPSVVCIEESPGASRSNAFFLANVFAMGERSLYDFTSAGPDRLTPGFLQTHDVVFLAGISGLSGVQVSALVDYVEQGGRAVISFGGRLDPEQYAGALQELGIGTLDRRIDIRQERSASAIIGEVDMRHPVFSVFSASGSGDLSRPRFREYAGIVPDSLATVIGRYDTNDPFLVERSLGEGRVLLMTSSFNTDWSDFPVNDVFLPFLYQLVKYALSAEEENDSFTVGDQVLLHGAPGDEWEVRTPAGDIVRAVIDDDGEGWFRGTDAPGNYQVAHGADQRFFSVNVDTRESNLDAKDAEEVYAAVSGRGDRSGNSTVAAALGDVTDEERNQKLWRYLLLVIVGLFLLETFLANRRISIDFGRNA